MPESHSLKVETNLPASMRDGTVLYADVYRPEGPGPFPVLLQRTPYDKTGPLSTGMLDPMRAAKNGYAVVIQDTRAASLREASLTASGTILTTGTTPSSGRPPCPGPQAR